MCVCASVELRKVSELVYILPDKIFSRNPDFGHLSPPKFSPVYGGEEFDVSCLVFLLSHKSILKIIS